jgi:hypothetical protein
MIFKMSSYHFPSHSWPIGLHSQDVISYEARTEFHHHNNIILRTKLYGVASNKTEISTFTAVSSSNLTLFLIYYSCFNRSQKPPKKTTYRHSPGTEENRKILINFTWGLPYWYKDCTTCSFILHNQQSEKRCYLLAGIHCFWHGGRSIQKKTWRSHTPRSIH